VTSQPGERASAAASRAGRSSSLRTLARLGYVISGVLHILIGWIALQLAWAGSSESADASGAFGALADSTPGLALLWAGALGFLALALWQATEAITATEAKEKVKAAGKTVVHLALAWSSLQFAIGSGSDSAEQSQSMTATLMSNPAGVALVIAIGLVIGAVGVYHVVKGARKKFLDDLQGSPGPFVRRSGQVGYIAKGVALVIVGALFVVAGIQNDPEEATGLDGALRTLLELPAGKLLITVVALGLAAYGVYSIARARHARL
jgi:hypothetical protein